MARLAQTLLPQIQSILSKSDLSTVSAKAVRKELVRRGADERKVKDARKEIDEVISDIYDRLTAAPPTASPPSSSRPQHPARVARSETPGVAPSSQPIALVDIKPKRERDVVKNERLFPDLKEETDADMAARLQREFDGLNSGRASRSTGTTAAKPKKKRKTPLKRKSRAELGSGSDGEPSVGGSEGGEKKKRKGGGGGAFNKELILSDALAALVDEHQLSRPQTVKRIWDYIKERDLQDPADKRYILCDEQMKSVFHTDRLHMFTMNKLLVPHFMDPAEIINGDAPVDEKKPVPKQEGASAASVQRTPVRQAEEEDSDSGYESSDYCGKSSGLL